MMGNYTSKKISIGSSESDSDSEILFEDCNADPEVAMQLDAINYESELKSFRPKEINNDILQIINDNLDKYEQVSFVYLVCKNSQTTLEFINKILNEKVNIFSLIKPNSNEIIEALCILQNYAILKEIGYSKDELKLRFLPTEKTCSLHINKSKKFFYRMFEDFTKDLEETFLEKVKKDCKKLNLQFPDYEYIEMYFLYFDIIGYINEKDSNYINILKVIKVMDLDVLYEELNEMIKFEKDKSCNIKGMIENFEAGPINDTRELNIDRASNSIKNLVPVIDEKYKTAEPKPEISKDEFIYKIDQSSPGVCLILEYQFFYPEFDDKYKDLVIGNRLEHRNGTEHDSNALQEIFKKMNYQVIYKSNLTHLEMMEIIRNTVKEIVTEKHSSFFICFLSHGLEGQIIASNSIPINISDVKNTICVPHLEGKPKVLIMQSCQGQETQKLCNDTLTTDGPKSEPKYKTVASTCDVLELWATVPGYAAIRNVRSGSWFIQTLCEVLETNNGRDHLLDICTIVNKKVSSKKWLTDGEINVMCCNYVTTLTKKLYLPQITS